MKNKNIIILLIIVIVGWIGYKIYYLNKYKSEKIIINTSQIFNKTIEIPNGIDNNNYETIKYKNLVIANLFGDYEEKENFKVKYNNEVVAYYSISSLQQYIYLLNEKAFLMATEDSNTKDYNTEDNIKKVLDKSNIKNDIDFLKYMKNNYYFQNNIITSVKKMRNNYIFNTFIQVAFPTFESIDLINGHVNGYIINMFNNIKEIHILNKDEQYIIVLSGSEITNDEFIIKLLSTVKFTN